MQRIYAGTIIELDPVKASEEAWKAIKEKDDMLRRMQHEKVGFEIVRASPLIYHLYVNYYSPSELPSEPG